MGKRNTIPLVITVLDSTPSAKASGVLIQVVHYSKHTRAFSSKIFGNVYAVRLAIPAFSTSTDLTGGFILEKDARNSFARFVAEDRN